MPESFEEKPPEQNAGIIPASGLSGEDNQKAIKLREEHAGDDAYLDNLIDHLPEEPDYDDRQSVRYANDDLEKKLSESKKHFQDHQAGYIETARQEADNAGVHIDLPENQTSVNDTQSFEKSEQSEDPGNSEQTTEDTRWDSKKAETIANVINGERSRSNPDLIYEKIDRAISPYEELYDLYPDIFAKMPTIEFMMMARPLAELDNQRQEVEEQYDSDAEKLLREHQEKLHKIISQRAELIAKYKDRSYSVYEDQAKRDEIIKNFDPTSKEARMDSARFLEWLQTAGAKLDASATHNNLATDLVVKDKERGGSWFFPLVGGIQVINSNDLKFMTRLPAMIGIEYRRKGEVAQDNPEQIEVRYTGIDDENRSSRVDTSEDPKFVPDK
jgi:hypothetical protein